jgi:hypothetical protein
MASGGRFMAENDDSWEKLPSELPHEVTLELFAPN